LGIVIPTEILLVCKKAFETCNFVGWVLINALTGDVGFSTKMSGNPTNQDLITTDHDESL